MMRIILAMHAHRDAIVFIACFLAMLIAVQINDDYADNAIRSPARIAEGRQ